MRGLLLAFSLLVLVFLVESQAATRQCNRLNASFFLPNCNNHSVLRVTKSADMYQVTLLATEWQCLNDFCLLNHQRHRQRNILCNETCIACHQLRPMSGCGTDAAVCELNVDTYLDEFCAQATSTIERVTTSTTTVCSVKLITTTVSVSPTHSSTLPHQCNKAKPTTSFTTPQMSTTSYRRQNQTPIKSVKTGESVLALIGTLLGLSVVLLAAVTTGWVCTCIYMKNKLAMDQSQQTSVIHMATASTSEDGEELQCSNNPSYEVMRLHRPPPSQTGSNEREDYVRVSDTYANVQ